MNALARAGSRSTVELGGSGTGRGAGLVICGRVSSRDLGLVPWRTAPSEITSAGSNVPTS